VPKFILAETELNIIIQFVESKGLKIGSNEQVYELINIQAQINETVIIFRVRAPIFEPTVYQLYHAIPIPINGTHLLVVPNYVAINKYKISFFNNQCSKVHETFICESEELGVDTKGKECLRKILMNKPQICDSVNLEGREMVLASEDGHILIFNALDLPVNNTCGEDMTVSGAIAIKYANCSIAINGIKYDGQVMEHKKEPYSTYHYNK